MLSIKIRREEDNAIGMLVRNRVITKFFLIQI